MVKFNGRAGILRQQTDGSTELALFDGGNIGNDAISIEVSAPRAGASATLTKDNRVSGRSFAESAGAKLTIKLGKPATGSLFIDGREVVKLAGNGPIVVDLPAGTHRWQIISGDPEPMASQITRTISTADGAIINAEPVPSATAYRLERSDDGGQTWSAVATEAKPSFKLTGVKPATKLHVRVIATNKSAESQPGRDYPVFVTGQPPEAPTGLRLKLETGKVSAEWGQILGAKEYILQRRAVGQNNWADAYRGSDRKFTEQLPGVIPAYDAPGLASAAGRVNAPSVTIYEYRVLAVDEVGTGQPSAVASTDPTSWRNWYPTVPMTFKRRSAYWMPPYVRPDQMPPAYYPE
jgi:hypothetical protein